MIDNIKQAIDWFIKNLTRKPTVIFHILGGVVCALLFKDYPAFAGILFVGFGLFELWQSIVNFILYARRNARYNKKDDEGYQDFWEFVFGAFIGAIILLVR